MRARRQNKNTFAVTGYQNNEPRTGGLPKSEVFPLHLVVKLIFYRKKKEKHVAQREIFIYRWRGATGCRIKPRAIAAVDEREKVKKHNDKRCTVRAQLIGRAKSGGKEAKNDATRCRSDEYLITVLFLHKRDRNGCAIRYVWDKRKGEGRDCANSR